MSKIEAKPQPDGGMNPSQGVDFRKLRHDMRGCIGIILTYMHILENAKPGTDLAAISKPCKEAAHDLEELIKVFERSDATVQPLQADPMNDTTDRGASG